jgi:hypothetical protein
MPIRSAGFVWTVLMMLAVACSHPRGAAGGPSASHPREAGIWWAPNLGLDSLASIDSRIERPFAEPIDVVHVSSKGQPAGQQRVTNCATYFVLQAKGFEPVSEIDSAALKVEGAKCHAVEALRRAKPASQTWPFELDQGALAKLPAALAPAPNPSDVESRDTATKAGSSWRGYDGSAAVISTGGGRIKIVAQDSVTKIEILGRADFDGDGVDDIMLLTVSQGTKGSWREIHLRVLTADPAGAILRIAQEIPV